MSDDAIGFESAEFRRPQPYPPREEPTIWLDWDTGAGVDQQNRAIDPVLGGRRTKNPILVDLLETARRNFATHLIVCGTVPTGAAWLLPDSASRTKGAEFTPGWTAGNHYLADPARGQFTHDDSNAKLRVSTSRAWFREDSTDTPLTPAQSRWLHVMLTEVVRHAIDRPDWALMRYPQQTMLNIWKLKAPDSYGMEWIDPDLGRLIAANEPQHRFERFTTTGQCSCGDCQPLVAATTLEDGFFYGDGRFMFAGVPKDIGAAPATLLDADQAATLAANAPYHPARYQVCFQVPDGWDTLGILPVKKESTGWHWPNRPGATHTTWAGAREIRLATEWGWNLEYLAAIQLTKANCLSPLITTVDTMLRRVDELRINDQPLPEAGNRHLKVAIRAMFRSGIGAMARRDRTTTHWAASIDDVPANAVDNLDPIDNGDGGFIYRTPSPRSSRDRDTWHPEIAAEVWSAARVMVLNTPTAIKDINTSTGKSVVRKMGALEIPPDQLLGITGDAIYTSGLQNWMLPADYQDGGDDGRNGRIRLKGWLPGPIDTPATGGDQQRAARAAEAHGLEDLPL